MAQKKVYDKEFKVQAVKLGREISFSKAAKEGRLDFGLGYPHSGNRNEHRRGGAEAQTAKPQPREETARPKEENEFLAEASAFFAASRRKSPKA